MTRPIKVALTGASGHLGAALLQELSKRNIPVNALYRDTDTRSCAGMQVNIVTGDIMNRSVLQQLMAGTDTVIHCAGIISLNGDPHGLMQQVNVQGTQLVMDEALQAGVKRCIHISSIHAFKQQPGIALLDETAAGADDSSYAYGRSKFAGQQIALAASQRGMEVIVINPTSIIGPYDFKPSLMGKAILDLYSGKLPFIFNGGFNYCDCRDVAQAIVNATSMGRPGELYLLGGQWHSLKQLTECLSAASSTKIKPIALSYFFGKLALPFMQLHATIKRTEPLYTHEVLDALFKDNRHISSAKAMAELGYSNRPFEETIRDCFFWFANNGYLNKK